MALSEVRTQIYLERWQHQALKRAAKRRAVTMAQVVREAVASYLADEPEPERDPRDNRQTYLADPLWKLPEIAETIGGSGEHAEASRLEEELYGPVHR
jgi:hypothetical protein